MTLSVDWKRASVSPQNPTITSVETAMPGTAWRISGQSLAVMLDCVLASHAAEHVVVAGLDRQVQVLADASGIRPSRRSIGPRDPTGAR